MGRASDTRSEAMNWQELEEHCATLEADRDKWQKIAEDAIAQRDAAIGRESYEFAPLPEPPLNRVQKGEK